MAFASIGAFCSISGEQAVHEGSDYRVMGQQERGGQPVGVGVIVLGPADAAGGQADGASARRAIKVIKMVRKPGMITFRRPPAAG
jgi:hypothetical protein